MPALVLVPSPLQASRAARRLCDAQDGVLFGPQVSTPGAQARAILAAAGDRRPILTPLAERLLAREAGRAAGGHFAAASPAGGLAAALAAALAELRRGEVPAAAARRAAGALPGAARERLLALAAALAAYEDRLDALGVLDAPGALRAAAEAARRGAEVAGARSLDLLVLDGFAAFSPGEWELAAALCGRAAATRFHAPAFPEWPDLSAAVGGYLRRVESLHELSRRRAIELVTTPADDPARAAGPAALLRALGGGPGGPPAPEGDVLALAAADEAGEAARAARLVADLSARGIAPGEVVLLHPAPSAAAERLRGAFAAEGIPFASGRGAPLAEAPPARAVLEALSAAARGLDRAAAERLAAVPGLAPPGLSGRLPRLLERAGALPGRLGPEAALRRRAASLDAAASRASREEQAALARAADSLAALAALLAPLGGAAAPGAHAARLAGFLDASGLRRRAARGEPALAARDLAALARLEEAAEDLARALTLTGRGDTLPAADWRDLLEVAVAGATLPAAGEPAAGAVELWGFDEAPGRTARAALLLGCARGAVPAPPRAEPLLREPERQAINELVGRAALATAGARRAEALHQVACAVAAGREVVAVAWPAGAGGASGAAPLLLEALRAAGVPVAPPPGEPPLSGARTAPEALRAAARAVRAEGAPRAAVLAALAPSGLAARAGEALDRGAVEAERRDAVLARRAAPHAGALSGEGLAALLARLPPEWSPTALETHARCPFRFLAAAGAGLADPEAAGLDIEPRDEGSLLHAVMERWVAARLARGAWPPAAAPADLAEAREVARALFARFEREGRTGDPAVWAARREAVLARLDRIVAGEAAAADGLVPTLLEFTFGGASGRPPLALRSGGEAVLVKGRIDRVDASPDRLLVVDYKNARDGARLAPLLAPESFGVESFQVPLYLLAAARELPGRRAAATYQLLRSAERLPPAEGTPDEAALAEAVVGAVRRIRAGDLPIVSRDCQGCPFGAVCRFEGVAELGEGGA